MPERPHPDMNRVRDALREAEEREETAPPEPEEIGSDPLDPDEDDGDT